MTRSDTVDLEFIGGPLDGRREKWSDEVRGRFAVCLDPAWHRTKLEHTYHYEFQFLGSTVVGMRAVYDGTRKNPYTE